MARTLKLILKTGATLNVSQGDNFSFVEFCILSRGQGFCFLRGIEGEIIVPFEQIVMMTCEPTQEVSETPH